MAAILHKLLIKSPPRRVYDAVTTQPGIESWWCKRTIAKPELGFINIFDFGNQRSEMKVTDLVEAEKADWECISSINEWIGTKVSFDMEERDGNTVLRFSHSGWSNTTDMFATCNYHWAQFLKSLKDFCETGTGSPQ